MADRAGAAVLDFTNTKEGGATFNKKRVPAGDYLARVTAVKDAPTKDTKEAQWLFSIELLEKHTDRKFPYYCKLVENQLWKIRNIFVAAGISVPRKKLKVDPNKVVGKSIGVTLDDDEYDGKMQSTIAAVFPPSELGDDGDSDDEEEVDTDEEEEEEETESEDEEEDDEDEEPAPKKKAKKKAPEPDEDEDEEEEEEEEDDEEEPPPPPKKSKKAKKAKKAPVEDDDDDLEEVDIEDM